jgi:NADH dehydrogenase
LAEEGHEIRSLIRPSSETPDLPRGVSIDVAISNISDERSLRAAVSGVDTVYHLVGSEWQGVWQDLHQTEIEGTRTLVAVAQDAGVKRIFYVSHLGADRASAYPVLKAKGIAEQRIRKSGIPYTIIRSGLVFGPRDNFTTAIARLGLLFPVFPTPGEGDSLVQPIWIEDLVTCLNWSLGDPETINKTYEVGGPEHLTIDDVVAETLAAAGINRVLMSARPSYMRLLGIFLEYLFPGLPLSIYWIDYLAAHRTTALDSLPRSFGLMPAQFKKHLDYLQAGDWRRGLLRDLLRRRSRR